MWDIVWVAPHVHRSLSARPQSLWQAPLCPWFVLRQFRVHHCFLGRLNPGGQIVGSWTKSQLTTEPQSSSNSEMMFTGIKGHVWLVMYWMCWSPLQMLKVLAMTSGRPQVISGEHRKRPQRTARYSWGLLACKLHLCKMNELLLSCKYDHVHATITSTLACFCRVCHAILCIGDDDVRLSRSCILSKWIKMSSKFLHHWVATPF